MSDGGYGQFGEFEWMVYCLSESSNWQIMPSEIKSMYLKGFLRLSDFMKERHKDQSYNPFMDHSIKDFLHNLAVKIWGD